MLNYMISPISWVRSASWATDDQEDQSNDGQKKENHLENKNSQTQTDRD